jgi:hypothetical protein
VRCWARPPFPLVLVEWEDAHSATAWAEPEDLQTNQADRARKIVQRVRPLSQEVPMIVLADMVLSGYHLVVQVGTNLVCGFNEVMQLLSTYAVAN